MDYSFFDGLIDAVFVIDDNRGVVYCNEAAARLCDTSVRRLAKGKPIHETIEFSDANLFLMPSGTRGRDEALPYVEIKFALKNGKSGKVQVATQPFQDPGGHRRWAVMVRDVTLEEVLHAKYHKQLEEKEVYIRQLKDAQAQLEAYSKNLEQMVEERTKQVNRANVMLSAIMNSLGQGFLVFDKGGVCSDFYTRACEAILECVPSKKQIWDVLRLKGKELETFHMWIGALFGEQLPFDSMKELGPSLYQHTQDRHVKLDYFPLRNESNKIENIVVVATDQTSEYQANRALEREKKYAQMVIKLVTGKKQFRQFLHAAGETINDLRLELMSANEPFDHEKLFRVLHTLEGEAGTYSATEIWAAARNAQEILEPFRKGGAGDVASARQALIRRVDEIRISYESFLSHNKELFSIAGIGQSEKIEVSLADVEGVSARLRPKGVAPVVCEDIANQLLREPAVEALRHYQDVVALVAQRLNRKVNPVKFHGENVKIFLKNYNDLFSSFVHIFRNIVDHGVEAPEEREMMGKDPSAQVEVSISEVVRANTKWIRFEISDDGQGVSIQALRGKLGSSMSQEEIGRLSEYDLIQKIFESGVTTKEAVGEFSGRGVGLNAVKIEAQKLGGNAWIESTEGKGTKLTIEVPDLQRVARQVFAA